MKKYNYIAVALLSSMMFLGSCNDDFLERAPQDKLSQSTFWTSEKDTYAALNAIYAYMNGTSIYDDGATDNSYAQYPWESNATSISLGDITTGTDAGWDFSGIRRVNYFLENIDKVPMDATLKTRFKAEARFIRAMLYAGMVNFFGDVPLITKTMTIEESYVGRTPKAEVNKFIADELGAVALILPKKYSGGKSNEVGRVTSGAALALKARVHLYNEQWQLAADECVKLMAMGYDLFKVNTESSLDKKDDYSKWVNFADANEETKFRLGLRSYEQLFWQENEMNEEVILDRQHIKEKDASYLNTFLLPDALGGWSSITPTQNLVNEYENFKTGLPITPITNDVRATRFAARSTNPAFYDEFKDRDPRFYATVLFETCPWNTIGEDYTFEWVIGGNNCSKTGYNYRKLVDPASVKEQIDNHANEIVIRFAEVLLTYAEAKNEATGPDASVYDAVDRIRTRAGMPVLDRNLYNTKEKLREAIRRERRIEFALEGHRYMDIRRWKIAPQVMKTITDLQNGLVQTREWTDKLYLMPVPQAQIDLNPLLKPNNPGY